MTVQEGAPRVMRLAVRAGKNRHRIPVHYLILVLQQDLVNVRDVGARKAHQVTLQILELQKEQAGRGIL